MDKWHKPLHRDYTVWVPRILVILFLALVAIGAYSGAIETMIVSGISIVLIIAFFFLLLGVYHISVIHHEYRDARTDPSDRIEEALSRANIDHTRVPKKIFSFGETFLLPNDMSIVVHFSSGEDGPNSYDIYVGPVTEYNETLVEKLKAFVDRALE